MILDKSVFIQKFKEKILHLAVTINDRIMTQYTFKLVTDIYERIFLLFPNLIQLELDLEDNCGLSPGLVNSISLNGCTSSSITYLRIRVVSLDACLYLLDGRLSQLHVFIVQVDQMRHSLRTNNK